jgi:hypothetical protein
LARLSALYPEIAKGGRSASARISKETKAMQPHCALITVPNAGTPVQLPAVPGGVEALLIKGLASNLGSTIFVGRASDFGKTSGVNLITDLNGADGIFALSTKEARNRIYLEQYWVDVATSGDKALVTWWVA